MPFFALAKPSVCFSVPKSYAHHLKGIDSFLVVSIKSAMNGYQYIHTHTFVINHGWELLESMPGKRGVGNGEGAQNRYWPCKRGLGRNVPEWKDGAEGGERHRHRQGQKSLKTRGKKPVT